MYASANVAGSQIALSLSKNILCGGEKVHFLSYRRSTVDSPQQRENLGSTSDFAFDFFQGDYYSALRCCAALRTGDGVGVAR
jgi:hypothetical protein